MHGFGSFRRGLHINAWLRQEGLLALRPDADPANTGEMGSSVDWSRTQAYAIGIGSIYLNLRGREARGVLPPGDAPDLTRRIAERLTGLRDPANGTVAVRGVATAAETYHGAYAAEAPDLVVRFAEGYRASWATALGGIPADLFEDNVKKWSGDHIVDPDLVPGVLLMSQPFAGAQARLVDLAPTVLSALGVQRGAAMEGENLLS